MEKFYKREYLIAEKEGKHEYSIQMKEIYREIVINRLTKPYHEVHNSLKMFPFINLN